MAAKRLFTEETAQEMVQAIKEGNTWNSTAVLDATFTALVDGTNTTKLFWRWYRQALTVESDRYTLLERWFQILADAWSDKRYILQYADPAVSNLTAMTPMGDLAGKTPAVLYTDSTPVGSDWIDEDPMTWYIRANARSKADGTMNVVAIEGESGFDATGDAGYPVYAFAMALWFETRAAEDGVLQDVYATEQDAGLAPFPGDVAPNGTKRIMTWHPCYEGCVTTTLATDQLPSRTVPTSGTGRRAWIGVSVNTALTTMAGNGENMYDGLWGDTDTIWLLRMWQLRHWDLENSNILDGCINYNLQKYVHVSETDVDYVTLAAADGADYAVGSIVEIGTVADAGASHDRGDAECYNLTHHAKIKSVEELEIGGDNCIRLHLKMDEGTITTTAGLTLVSTMPYDTGDTDVLPAHKDGCRGGLTAGKHPARVAGVEFCGGAYTIGADPIYSVAKDNDTGELTYSVYIQRTPVRANVNLSNYIGPVYTKTFASSGWKYVKTFQADAPEVMFPDEIGGSSLAQYKSAFYVTGSAGLRVPWRFGNLNNGDNAGLACENGNNTPTNANWNGRPRITHTRLLAYSPRAAASSARKSTTPRPQKCGRAGVACVRGE